MAIFFGTDGVRGIANLELTPQLAFDVGRFGAYVLTQNSGHGARIFVGKDTRISCDMLECALIAGMLSVGAHVELLGVIPTPAVAYLAKKHGADAGAVISASHNSVEYNGIKFFNSEGFKLNDEIELEIEEYILGNKKIKTFPTGTSIGRLSHFSSAEDEYADFVSGVENIDLNGMKIVLDCANGASSFVAPKVFRHLGCELEVICNVPDGANINDGCGSTHIDTLCNHVRKTGADLGLAFDGDADRLIAADENGNVIDGDVIIALYALHLKTQNKLPNNLVVGTVMSNLGFVKSCNSHGIEVLQTKVGDRYVLEKMLETGSTLGGEQSGHVISLHDNTTGDGLATAVHFAALVKRSTKPASQVAKEIKILPQVLFNAKVPNDRKHLLTDDSEIAAFKKQLDEKYADCGRLLLRPSGTEPLVRVMLEGENYSEIEKDARQFAGLIEARLNF